MEFYKINNPTTQQIFDAIINDEYTPIEKIQPKAKQIEVLLQDHFGWGEVLVTFNSVTNSGGVPVFLSSNCSLYEIASDHNEDFYELSEEEQDEIIELLGCYMRTYKDVFNIN